MTALAGIWRLDGQPDAAEQCQRMLASQQIYADGKPAVWDDGNIALGRAMFHLLPEDRFDRQPLIGAGGKLVLIGDLRIDNRDELISALGQGDARDMADSALALAAYERWGEAMFDRLVGEFALALFDLAAQRLLLARDHLGLRPLHYHRSDRLVAFASMPKGLHALAEVPRAPDLGRVSEFVAVLPESGSGTCFAGVERVESGQVVTITRGGISARRHWDPQPLKMSRPAAGKDWAEGLRYHLDMAVAARLRGADQAVATHLSAGLDSSSVTATAARLMAERGGRVVAFTSVPRPRDGGYLETASICDEGPHAALTAQLYPNIEHVRIVGGERSPMDFLDQYFHAFEQPVRDLPSGEWFVDINAKARQQGLRILLPAYMGNLSLSYDGFDQLGSQASGGQWLTLARQVAKAVRGGHLGWKSAARLTLGPLLPPAIWRLVYGLLRGDRGNAMDYSAVHPGRIAEIENAVSGRQQRFAIQRSTDAFAMRLWAMRRVDLGNFNKGTLGMTGIDQRDPLADRRLVEYCLGVPPQEWFADGRPRALTRRALADRLPPQVLDESRRGQQSADWRAAMQADQDRVLEEIDRLECTSAASVVDLPRMRDIASRWPAADSTDPQESLTHRQILLRGIAAGHFCRKASGSNA